MANEQQVVAKEESFSVVPRSGQLIWLQTWQSELLSRTRAESVTKFHEHNEQLLGCRSRDEHHCSREIHHGRMWQERVSEKSCALDFLGVEQTRSGEMAKVAVGRRVIDPTLPGSGRDRAFPRVLRVRMPLYSNVCLRRALVYVSVSANVHLLLCCCHPLQTWRARGFSLGTRSERSVSSDPDRTRWKAVREKKLLDIEVRREQNKKYEHRFYLWNQRRYVFSLLACQTGRIPTNKCSFFFIPDIFKNDKIIFRIDRNFTKVVKAIVMQIEFPVL